MGSEVQGDLAMGGLGKGPPPVPPEKPRPESIFDRRPGWRTTAAPEVKTSPIFKKAVPEPKTEEGKS